METYMKTERKKNLERGYSHISWKECKIISRKYDAQGLAGFFTIYAKQTVSR